MPMELFNERQETIFDTKLTKAADAYAKAVLEVGGWKKKLTETKRDLIVEMKRMNCKTITMPQNKRLEYKFTDAKEDIVIKDFKPKEKKFKRGFAGRA